MLNLCIEMIPIPCKIENKSRVTKKIDTFTSREFVFTPNTLEDGTRIVEDLSWRQRRGLSGWRGGGEGGPGDWPHMRVHTLSLAADEEAGTANS